MQSPVMLHRDTEFDTCHPEDHLCDFLDFCANVVSRYEGNSRACNDYENTLQDLLHYIEMTDDDNPEICLAIREARRQRRLCKNENDLLQPFYEFISDKSFVNKLQQILGKVRLANERVTKRTYIARTDTIEKIINQEKRMDGDSLCQT